jgi:Mrp family chromosome partitioning ATPase/capsular polysaccharide biosynthesis protein
MMHESISPALTALAVPDAAASDSLWLQLWRRKKWFLWTALGIMLPALLAIMILRPSYYAEGKIIIGEQDASTGNASAAYVQKLGDPADVESQLLVIESRRMLRLALTKPGVADALERECVAMRRDPLNTRSLRCESYGPESGDALDHASQRYAISAAGRSRVIAIGYTSPLPDVASMMSNAMIMTYLEDQKAENAPSREQATNWLLTEAERLDANAKTRTLPAQAEARKQFYEELHRQVADLEAERSRLLTGARLVSLAEVPSEPFFPRRSTLLAAALTVASLLGAFVALRRDASDNSVLRPAEVAARAKVPLLAAVPRAGTVSWLTGRAPAIGGQLRRGRKSQGVRAAVHGLYTELMAAGDPAAHKRILLASVGNATGKALVASLLAEHAAELGKRVLLLNADPSDEALAGAMGVGAVGSPVVEGGDAAVPGSWAAVPTAFNNVGFARANPAADTSEYDLVILNGPSSGSGAEIRLAAAGSDGVVMCAAWGSTHRDTVLAALQDLRQRGVPVLGLVVTDVDVRRAALFQRPGAALRPEA